MNSSVLEEKTSSITSLQKVNGEVMDLSDDSGFSTISISSTNTNNMNAISDDMIVNEDVELVDVKRLEEEKQRVREAEQKKRQQRMMEKRAENEAFEKEIQDQQYKRLMHLLSQSKAFANFMSSKFDSEKNQKAKSKKQKQENIEENNDPPPTKKSRRSTTIPKNIEASNKNLKNNKRKLSGDDIIEELSMSDEEIDNKENTEPTTKTFVQPKYFKGELHEHQKVGLNWLKVLYENGLNGILADEMGLGKTIQVIALFSYLMEKQIQGPYMVLVPLSTLSNWESEFKRFAPEIPVVVYYGSAKERPLLKKKLEREVRVSTTFKTLPVVIMTYQMILYDTNFLQKFKWRYIVIDEAQRIKNNESQMFRLLKTYKSVNRLLLTGTPLQNNLNELWSLLNFLLPEIFNNLSVFESWFDAKEFLAEEGKEKFLKQEQEKQVIATLREILQPFLLRRLKEDACPDIPPLKEVIVHTPLTGMQYNLYSAILNKDIDTLTRHKTEPVIVDINGVRPKRRCTHKVNWNDVDSTKLTTKEKTDVDKDTISMWNKYTNVTEDTIDFLVRIPFGNRTMMYRHVINHPYLIHYPLNDCGVAKVDDNLIKVSGKLLVLDAILKKLKSNGHKVLLFSTMSMVLDIIEDYLSMRNYQYVRLDGQIKHENRRNNIDKFQTDPEVFIFLLTTKAGAVGLNLAAADTVIIYDSDWNPQNDLQAMARCHRIGQNRPVVVYRFCTKGTIDEEIIKRANAKRFLEKAVISKDGSLVNSSEGLKKLKTLLEESALKIADPKKAVYTEAELDKLLDRSTILTE